jgi:DNA-binding IclR family transcriptional regulator
LSKASVYRGLKKLERLGALQIEHGRYNPQTKNAPTTTIKQGFILRQTKVSG